MVFLPVAKEIGIKSSATHSGRFNEIIAVNEVPVTPFGNWKAFAVPLPDSSGPRQDCLSSTDWSALTANEYYSGQ